MPEMNKNQQILSMEDMNMSPIQLMPNTITEGLCQIPIYGSYDVLSQDLLKMSYLDDNKNEFTRENTDADIYNKGFTNLLEKKEELCQIKVDKGKRFSKKNDKEIFKILNLLCKQRGILITNFWKDDLPLLPTEETILKELAKKIQWKSNPKLDLLRRIRRIGLKSTFSVRENKLLRRMVKVQIRLKNSKSGSARFKGVKELPKEEHVVILEHFPGKALDMLFDQYNTNIINLFLSY